MYGRELKNDGIPLDSHDLGQFVEQMGQMRVGSTSLTLSVSTSEYNRVVDATPFGVAANSRCSFDDEAAKLAKYPEGSSASSKSLRDMGRLVDVEDMLKFYRGKQVLETSRGYQSGLGIR